MNKKINIIKNAYVLFVVNIIVLLTLIFFRSLYSKLGYSSLLINILFVINLVLLLVGIIFNVLFVKSPKKYDNKKYIILILVIFVVYLLLNTLFVNLINKSLTFGYTKINSKLASYCDNYDCDKYETITKDGYEEFIIEKNYFDYNNEQNKIKIVTKYNTDKILLVSAEIYSKKEMFSETLIANNIRPYFDNFKYEVSDKKIREAFENRFSSSIIDGKTIYKVTEIYNDDNELENIKTNITLNLK